MQNEGRIELIVGPMFAGKTTELMRRVKREIHARRLCFVIKFSRDTRYSRDHVSSHDKVTLRAKAAVSTLRDVGEEWKHHEVIAVDEGQFFPDLLEFCKKASDAGKLVIVSALDGDFQRKPFGHVCELVPLCESVTKLTAVCMMCHTKEASFTRRTVASEAQELIGGADMYIATCRSCYLCPAPPSPRRMVRVRDAIREVEQATLREGSSPNAATAPSDSEHTSSDSDSSPDALNSKRLECPATLSLDNATDASPSNEATATVQKCAIMEPEALEEPVAKKARIEA